MKKQSLPPGWDENRVRKIIAHYDNQTEEEELAEFEAAFNNPSQTMMSVPTELVPAITRLITKDQKQKAPQRNGKSRRTPAKAGRRRMTQKAPG